MKILCLWLSNYHSGTASQFFKSSLKGIGAKVKEVFTNSHGVENALLTELGSEKYDYIFHVPHPGTIRHEVLKFIKERSDEFYYGVKVLGWMGDDEWCLGSGKPHDPALISSSYHYLITTSKPAVMEYKRLKIKNVILSQWGYGSKDWRVKKRKKEIDVYFCGAKTPERDMYIQAMMDNGIKFVVDGRDYGISAYDGFRNQRMDYPGRVTFETMRDRYAAARIGINFNFSKVGGEMVEQVKARTFEIPAVGTFQLCSWCKELKRFFKDGKELVTFGTPMDMVKKIKYYLKNDGDRESIAFMGHVRNLQYSYEKLFKSIFERIK